jgi:hypothetical protein
MPADLCVRFSDLASTPSSKTNGDTRIQKSAFAQLLQIAGEVEFIACRPKTGRRGFCSSNLSAILREMAGVELRKWEKLRELAGLELGRQRLLRQAAEPGDPDRRSCAGGNTQ